MQSCRTTNNLPYREYAILYQAILYAKLSRPIGAASPLVCQPRIKRTLPKRRNSVLFVKFSLEVHIVRLRSPLPKIIENIGVWVACEFDGEILG